MHVHHYVTLWHRLTRTFDIVTTLIISKKMEKHNSQHQYAVPPLLDFTSWHTGTFYSVPGPLTSSQYPFLSPPCQSVSWRFITLGCNTWLSPLSSLTDYMTLIFLFLWKWNASLTLHPHANSGIKVSCALRNGWRCAFALCSVICQHTPAAFQSESQQCRMNGEEQRVMLA